MLPLVFTFLLLLLDRASAQSCEPFGGQPSVCSGLINYDVYIPPNITQVVLAIGLTNEIGYLGVLPGPCARATLEAACAQAFRACNPLAPELPLPICPALCEQQNDACTGPLGSSARLNCSSLDPFLTPAGINVPLWSDTRENFEGGGLESCRVPNGTEPNASALCIYPFLWNPNADTCTIKCPPTGVDNESQNHTIWVTLWVLGVLSLIGCLFHVPPMALQYRSGKGGYALWWFVCQAIGYVGILSGKWLTPQEFACSDKWTIRRGTSTVCAVSFLFFYYGFICSTLWITVVMYKILLGMTRGRVAIFGTGPISFVSEQTAFLFICFVPHFIVALVALGKNWVSGIASSFCSIDPAIKWAFYGMQLIPLTVYCFINFLITIAVLYYVLRTGTRAVRSQWRIFALGLYYTAVVTIVITISFYQEQLEGKITAHIESYIACRLGSDGSSSHLCTYVPVISFHITYLVNFLLSSVGLFMSLLFMTRASFSAWRYIIGRSTGLMDVSDWRADSMSAGSSATNSTRGAASTRSGQSSNL